jgi:hypothetical protein
MSACSWPYSDCKQRNELAGLRSKVEQLTTENRVLRQIIEDGLPETLLDNEPDYVDSLIARVSSRPTEKDSG